jgi:hypothetical protein
LKIYNNEFTDDNAVFPRRYRMVALGTDIMVGFVKACRARRRERMLCAVAMEMQKMHETRAALIQS